MGFFSALDALLDENSDNSLEKKLGHALDKVEATLGATLDKADGGVKKLEQVGHAADKAAAVVTKTIDKTDEVTGKVTSD